MQANDTSFLLRRALMGNAAFSTLTGITLLLAARPLGPVLGAPPLALVVVGLSLLPFALGLWRNARRPEVKRSEAWISVMLDLVWVAASAALVLGELWPLRAVGTWVVVIVADFVFLCAVLQWIGLARTGPSPGNP